MAQNESGIDATKIWMDRLCDDFERRWSFGKVPALEEYLKGREGNDGAVLLRELLLVELEVRFRNGESPKIDDYLARFPVHRELLVTTFEQFFASRPTKIGDGTFDTSRSAESTDATLISKREYAASSYEIPGYAIHGELGRGGMGVVYRATQKALNRTVALKTIRAGSQAADEEIKRFVIEAEAAAGLDHPNIVPIYEIGKHAGVHFFSMGFVDGQGLDAKLKEGPLPPREAADLIWTIATTLHFAHERGIVHRDLKPANVLIDADGKPRITDFGLAKNIASDDGLTVTGQVMGTPSYMPPEQAAGRKDQIGPLSDVYSLGAMLYALLTGRPPFQAANVMETLKQVCDREPVSPGQLNPAVDRDLETICLKCLEKEPSRRYATSQSLAEDLQCFLDGRPIAARPVGQVERAWRWCKRNSSVAILGGTALFLLIAGAIISTSLAIWATGEAERADQRADDYLVEKEEAEKQRGIAQTQKGIAETQTLVALKKAREANEERERFKRLDYSGQIARSHFEWGVDSAPAAARERLGRTDPSLRGWEYHFLDRLFNRSHNTLRGHSFGFTALAWSPNGDRIVSGGGDKTLMVWELATRNGRRLTGHTGVISSVAFSPDGKLVASGSLDKTVRVWDAETGKALFAFSGHSTTVHSVAFGHDGNRIVSAGAEIIEWDLAKWHRSKEKPVRLPPRDRLGKTLAVWFNADVSRVVTRSNNGELKVWNATENKEVCSLKGITGLIVKLAIGPNGRRIVGCTSRNVMLLWDGTTGQRLAIRRQSSETTCLTFSSDGKRFAGADSNNLVRTWDAIGGVDLGSMRGHTSRIESVAFSPDGTQIASGSFDNTMKIWGGRNGPSTKRLARHLGGVAGLAFSPDSQRAATGGLSGDLKVWKLDDQTEFFSVRAHDKAIWSVCFSPDGKRVVTASWDKTAAVWEIGEKQPAFKITAHTGIVWCAAFSPDGTRIATCSNDKTVKIWDAKNGALVRSITAHSAPVRWVAFSPDGLHIASASADASKKELNHASGEIKIWNIHTGALKHRMWGHESLVTSVSYSPDGKQIVSSGMDSTVILWDAETGHQIRSLRGHRRFVERAVFTGSGDRIVTCGTDKTIKVWDPVTGATTLSLRVNTTVGQVACSPDGRYVLSASPEIGISQLWDGEPGQETTTCRGHTGEVNSVAISADGRRIISGSLDSTIRVTDSVTGQLLQSLNGTPLVLQGHHSTVTTVSISPDGHRIVSGSGVRKKSSGGKVTGELRIWNAETGNTIRTVSAHDGVVTTVAFGPNGRKIVSGGHDGKIKVWDAETAELIRTLKGHNGFVSGLAFSADGKLLASGGSDKLLKVWDIENGVEALSVPAHDNMLYSVAFSPDGKRIATGGGVVDLKRQTYRQGEIRIWEASSGKLLQSLKGHFLPAWCVSFSPDGRYLVSGSVDYTLILWDAKSGDSLVTMRGHDGWIRTAIFTPDSKQIVSGSGDGTVKIWEIDRVLRLRGLLSRTPSPYRLTP